MAVAILDLMTIVRHVTTRPLRHCDITV